MGVLAGTPGKIGYPVAKKKELESLRGNSREPYMVHLTKKLLENYRTFMAAAETKKQL